MKYVPLIITSLLLVSCELAVDIDVPLERPSLTLNSFFAPDSLWQVEVYLNRHVLDDHPFAPVKNANVVIYKDGIAIETLQSNGDGTYQSVSGKAMSGQEYEIRAESPDYGTVSGKSYAPVPVKISNVEATIPQRNSGPINGNNNMDEYATFTIKFPDQANEANYYLIRINTEATYRLNTPTGPTTTKYLRPLYIEFTDPAQADNYDYTGEGLIVDDIFFDGKEASLQVKTSLYSFGTNDTIFIYLRTLSEDFYKYKKTQRLQENSKGDPFSQPVKVYNNIQNGFGIVAGYSEDLVIYPQ